MHHLFPDPVGSYLHPSSHVSYLCLYLWTINWQAHGARLTNEGQYWCKKKKIQLGPQPHNSASRRHSDRTTQTHTNPNIASVWRLSWRSVDLLCFSLPQRALHLSVRYLSGWSPTPYPPFYEFISLAAAWFVGQLWKHARARPSMCAYLCQLQGGLSYPVVFYQGWSFPAAVKEKEKKVGDKEKARQRKEKER